MRPAILVLVLIASFAGSAIHAVETRVEATLFITGATDECRQMYDSIAEEADLRGTLTRLHAAAQIAVEEKPDAITTTMRLLRKATDGKVELFTVHYQEVLTLTMNWKKTDKGEIDRDTALAEVYGFMNVAKAASVAEQKK